VSVVVDGNVLVALIFPERHQDSVTVFFDCWHATDSTYVCLAERLGTTVWTLDGSLARNASDCGLPVALLS
jgi:hypothetical protein